MIEDADWRRMNKVDLTTLCSQCYNMKIDLKLDAKPFKSLQFRSGTKTQELKRAEIENQGRRHRAGHVQFNCTGSLGTNERWQVSHLYR